MRRMLSAAALAALVTTVAAAQTAKPKGIVHDVTIRAADATTYAGTMDLVIQKGKVTGDMLISVPTEITGKISGTAEAGVLKLDFPYHMTEQGCDGNVKMHLTVPQKQDPSAARWKRPAAGWSLGSR